MASDAQKEHLRRVRHSYMTRDGAQEECEGTEEELFRFCEGDLNLAQPSLVCSQANEEMAKRMEVEEFSTPPVGFVAIGEAWIAGLGVAAGVCERDDAVDSCCDDSKQAAGFLWAVVADLHLFNSEAFQLTLSARDAYRWMVESIIDEAVRSHG